MAKYLFRCFIGRGKMSVSDLETRINDWVSSNGEWTEDDLNHSLKEKNTELNGSGSTYYQVDVRFLKDDTKSNLVQKFEDKLQNKVDWYRLYYHDCIGHDTDTTHHCGWGDDREWTAKDVTIPSGVPTFDVQ